MPIVTGEVVVSMLNSLHTAFFYILIFLIYIHRSSGEYNISRRGRSAQSYFLCVVYEVLARYFVLF